VPDRENLAAVDWRLDTPTWPTTPSSSSPPRAWPGNRRIIGKFTQRPFGLIFPNGTWFVVYGQRICDTAMSIY
jgi:hypothetical protein